MTDTHIPSGMKPEFDEATASRFWSRVNTGDEAGCWLWTGARHTDRGRTRGRFYANYKTYTASAVATVLAHGARPNGAEHLHSCDNPLCCNPAHLRWGSHAENMAEMAARGRGTRKSHCKYGHPLSGDNVRLLKRGNRECRACQDRRKQEYLKRINGHD